MAKDLSTLLPDDLFNHPDCYSSSRYWLWERDVATPALKDLGYEVGYWSSGDEDSFGPLVRMVSLSKDGDTQTYFYG